MSLIIQNLHSLISSVGPFFLLLGLLIFVHELGHFAVAKFFGVRVETFSLGFGRKLLKYKKGDTTYCVSLFPLGGYVKMFGDDPSVDVPPEDRAHAFLHKPLLQRTAVVLAGPLMNLFFAIFLYVVVAGVGIETPAPVAGDIAQTSAAYQAGLRSGDKILSIDGVETPTWAHIRRAIEKAGGHAVEMNVERAGEPQPLKFEVGVTTGENENVFSMQHQVGRIEGLTQDSRSTLIGVKDSKSLAGEAGFKTFDVILAINDVKVSHWRDLNDDIRKALATTPGTLTFKVQNAKENGQTAPERTLQVKVPPNFKTDGDLTEKLGLEPSELFIVKVTKDSPAEKAGIQPGDRVAKLNGDDVHSWNDVLNHVKAFDASQKIIHFALVRDGKEIDTDIQPEMTPLMNLKGQEEHRYTVGIVSGFSPARPEMVFYRPSGALGVLSMGWNQTVTATEYIVVSLFKMVAGEVSAKNVGGFITIGKVASMSFKAGFSNFLDTMAIISINLFLINLLPVPVLDGGHLVFYAIEALQGAPLSLRKMEIAQQIGLMLLMFLMVFAFYNDITNNFFSRW
jgi:regulator of sigma E protease